MRLLQDRISKPRKEPLNIYWIVALTFSLCPLWTPELSGECSRLPPKRERTGAEVKPAPLWWQTSLSLRGPGGLSESPPVAGGDLVEAEDGETAHGGGWSIERHPTLKRLSSNQPAGPRHIPSCPSIFFPRPLSLVSFVYDGFNYDKP